MNCGLHTFADDRPEIGRSDPATPGQDFIDRLESRLALLNEQIIKLSALAAKATDEEIQERYWTAAREVSREARAVRQYLKTVPQRP